MRADTLPAQPLSSHLMAVCDSHEELRLQVAALLPMLENWNALRAERDRLREEVIRARKTVHKLVLAWPGDETEYGYPIPGGIAADIRGVLDA